MSEVLIQDVIVDLTESQQVVVYANQYDEDSRTVRCHIQNQGVDFDCSGYKVNLWIMKSNGKGLSVGISEENFGDLCSVSGNIITFPITKEMTYSFGRQECRFELKGTNIIYSCNFYFRVNKAPNQIDDVIDSDDYQSLYDDYYALEKKIGELPHEVYTTNDDIPIGQKVGDYWTELL